MRGQGISFDVKQLGAADTSDQPDALLEVRGEPPLDDVERRRCGRVLLLCDPWPLGPVSGDGDGDGR